MGTLVEAGTSTVRLPSSRRPSLPTGRWPP